jgi:hypothetical protein
MVNLTCTVANAYFRMGDNADRMTRTSGRLGWLLEDATTLAIAVFITKHRLEAFGSPLPSTSKQC